MHTLNTAHVFLPAPMGDTMISMTVNDTVDPAMATFTVGALPDPVGPLPVNMSAQHTGPELMALIDAQQVQLIHGTIVDPVGPGSYLMIKGAPDPSEIFAYITLPTDPAPTPAPVAPSSPLTDGNGHPVVFPVTFDLFGMKITIG